MAFTDELRRLIDRLKEIIDLHDLAEKLGLERPGGAGGNYRSPGHKDSSPSLSLFPKDFATGFKDHSDPDKRGDCVALYQYVMGGEAVAAVKALCEMYGIEYTLGKESRSTEPKREKSRAEYIAERCLAQPIKALDYLMKERGISERVARHAIDRKAVGWNDFKSTKVEPGKPGHGGDAAAFIVRTLNPGHIVAVDLRYLDPALNGNVKTQCQGEKDGYGWVSDIRRLHSARTVYVVESPINALSLECVIRPDEAAFAIRGVGNVENIDWAWARGKQIIVVFDNDEPFPAFKDDGKPHPQAGIRPGLKAAWALHERLTALDISALLVDQADWEVNDCNDFLKHVVATMNAHIKETSGDRHPWVWIMQTLLSEIAANTFEAPFIFDYHEQQHCLMVRTSDVMHHMKTRPALRDIWNALPVKSDRVFKRQLTQAEVIVGDVERTIGTKRVAHLAAISLTKLETFGLHAVVPQNKI